MDFSVWGVYGTVFISPTWQNTWKCRHYLSVRKKLEIKILVHLAQSIESKIMDGFWYSGCLNDRIDLPYMIGSFPGGTTSSMVAKNWTKKLSQPFEELQGWNSEFKLITPKTIWGTYFKTNLCRFGLAGFPLTAILDTLGQSRDHLEIILGLFWDYFGTILGQF